ncbi:uncharacterized protein At3g43530-like [Eutrema salsugineum]|uniref:uncharacterized protein At3g43530-like n=1 Tax=Eutrema salsugineum TaxID=72664 RepID=UPI000CECEB75|nr:uncharacterized protein At3g43530-like [Eutrema salsugineum]
MRELAHPDRLKMCVAYFLSSIISGKTKNGKGAPSVDPLFLRIVDDLEACKRFPWGRYSFDVNMKDIEHTMRHFKGVVETDAWTFPSFVTPLELLAFEAFPCLKNKYRDEVRGSERDCPRMCRQKFQSFTLKGFPLSELYETLGNTKVIESILQLSEDAVIMLAGVMEMNEEEDVGDIVPENWTRRLVKEKKPIFWKEICKIDVDARDNKEWVNHPAAAKNNVGTENVAPLGLVEQIQSLQKSGEKLESVVTTEKARKQKQPKKKQKEPEQKEAEQKEAEQKEPEMNVAELNEAEMKETKQKEAEQLVEPDGADAVNAEVGTGKRKQEQSKLGPNTRQRR